VHIRNHFRPWIGKQRPIPPGFGKKGQIIRVVNRLHCGKWHGFRRAWRKPDAMQRRFQRRRAGGDFKISADATALQEKRGVMPGMIRMGEGLHQARLTSFALAAKAPCLLPVVWLGSVSPDARKD